MKRENIKREHACLEYRDSLNDSTLQTISAFANYKTVKLIFTNAL